VSFSRTTRVTAVVAAAAALTVGAAGAASATTSTSRVDGRTVSMTFTPEAGQFGDACIAALTTPAHATVVADKLTNGDLDAISKLPQDKELIVLATPSSPVVFPNVLTGPVTVTASNVPANVYTLLSYCVSSRKPAVTPVTVGDPLAVAQGSMASMSAEGAPAAMSSMLGKAVTGGVIGGR